MEPLAATISFCGEAYDAAAYAFRQITGYLVEVETTNGEKFDAFIGAKPSWDVRHDDNPIRVNEENGQYEVMLGISDETSAPTGEIRWADIYDDIRRVTVY